MANQSPLENQPAREGGTQGIDLAAAAAPSVERSAESPHNGRSSATVLAAALPSLTASIELLRYPELLFDLVQAGAGRPLARLEFQKDPPPVIQELVKEFTELLALEMISTTTDRGGDKITSIFVYDRRGVQELIPKLAEIAEKGRLIIDTEEFGKLPKSADEFVNALISSRSSARMLLSDIVKGDLPSGAGLSGRDIDPSTFDPVRRGMFEAISAAALAGQARALEALRSDFTDLIATADPANVVEVYQSIMLSQYRRYETAMRTISTERVALDGIVSKDDNSFITDRTGNSYVMSSTMSDTFETTLYLKSDLRVGLDMDEQRRIVEQRLKEWTVHSIYPDMATVQAGESSSIIMFDGRATHDAVEAMKRNADQVSLLEIAGLMFRTSMVQYGQLIATTLDQVGDRLQPSKCREIRDLTFVRWEDAHGHLRFLETQEWSLSRLLDAGSKKSHGFDEDLLRGFWAGSRIDSNGDLLSKFRDSLLEKQSFTSPLDHMISKFRGALQKSQIPRAPISDAEWQKAWRYAETTAEQMYAHIKKRSADPIDPKAALMPGGSSSVGYLGEGQELRYQLMADFLTFTRAGLDAKKIGAFLHQGLNSMKSGDPKYLDTWQPIGEGIEILEPSVRPRQSHISPFYGPVWTAFGDKAAPDFQVRNARMPGFVVTMFAESISLAKDFGFLQGEEYKPELKTWRELEYRVSAADLASIFKGKFVPEVPYSEVAEMAAKRAN